MTKEFSAIIIDDDPGARKILKKFIEEGESGVRVVTSLEDTTRAIAEIEKFHPDILFLDINMPREDGLCFAQRLQLTGIDVRLIFTTAYRNYALDAFSLKPFDFLVKPFTVGELDNVLQKAKESLVKSSQSEKAEHNQHKIKFKTANGYRFVYPGEIVFIRSTGNNCELFVKQCEAVCVHATISGVFKVVKPYNFLQINRSTIINLDFLTRIDRKKRICFLNCGTKEHTFRFTNKILSYFEKMNSIKLG